MTVKELREYAKNNNIQLPKKYIAKNNLIDLIIENVDDKDNKDNNKVKNNKEVKKNSKKKEVKKKQIKNNKKVKNNIKELIENSRGRSSRNDDKLTVKQLKEIGKEQGLSDSEMRLNKDKLIDYLLEILS